MYVLRIFCFFCYVFAFVSGQRLVDNLRTYIKSEPYPVINEFTIRTNVTNRFAETTVTSRVYNKFDRPHQTTFSVVLPDTAFVTGFNMVINGREYKSFVDEHEKVRRKYTSQSYHGAGHVGISARDSNEFDITVNLEPKTTTVFNLYYEELLERKKSKYQVLSNIFPRQLVEIIDVEIYINEDEIIEFINEPYLRTGNEILNSTQGLDANAIVQKTDHWAVIKFTPSLVKQFKLACYGLGDRDSFAAQFVVEYDIDRSSQNQVMVNDGYFISFFAPTNIEPLTKHLTFVLDTSWSMGNEQRLVHLKKAMSLILPMLQPEDVFNIVSFARIVTVWNLEDLSSVNFTYINDQYNAGLTPNLYATDLAKEAMANQKNIDAGIQIVEKFVNDENTNIIGALTVALEVIKRAQDQNPSQYQPILIFLTDGEPVGAMTDTDRISTIFRQMNTLEVPTYTISLGQGANRTFLYKLAKENGGFEKHIYDGVDADMQLHTFYDDINLPLLKNVQYKNLQGITDLTQSKVPLVFQGTEVKVAGKGGIWKITKNSSPSLQITGQSKKGTIEFNPSVKVPSSKLDKLWAFLTVKQLLSELKLDPSDHEARVKALNISLTYSLVTDVTALVVVKPNEVSSVDVNNAYKGPRPTVAQNPVCQMIEWPMNSPQPYDPYNPWITTTTTTQRTTTRTTTAPSTTEDYTYSTTSYNFQTVPSRNTPGQYAYPPTSTINYWTTRRLTTTTTPPTTAQRDQCKIRPDYSNFCNEYKIGFYFNGQACGLYRGCEDIFKTEDECVASCLKTTESCKLPQDRGPCANYSVKYSYNATARVCTQFWYGGCDGNGNRFDTQSECENLCLRAAVNDHCTLEKDPGQCTSFVSKWYYDVAKNKCLLFDYGGCGGNDNQFSSKAACESECLIIQTN